MNKYIKRISIVLGGIFFLLPLTWAQQRSCGMLQQTDRLRSIPAQNQLHENSVLKFKRYAATQARLGAVLCTNPVQLPVAIHFQGIINPDTACLRALVQNQMSILNADFQGKNADTTLWQSNAHYYPGLNMGQTCLEFVIANKNHPEGYHLQDGDPAVTINSTTGDYVYDWTGYINIVVRDIGDLGYAPLGGLGNGDGINVDDNAFGTFGCGQVLPNYPYNLGRTLVHEMGHYLYLNHIWANESDIGGCSNDDGVSDTPFSEAPNYGCPTLPTSCNTMDLYMNYMDYVNDSCMYMFSAGQSERMNNWITTNLQTVVTKKAEVYLEICEDCTPPVCIDNDKDGYCSSVDCNDANSAVPAASGSLCDDNNPNTYQDIIQLDGCTCAGIPNVCKDFGGDTDADGVCDALDCDPFDACYPKALGTACDDGNSGTTEDKIQADGCTCAGKMTIGNATTVHVKVLLEGLYDPIYQRLNKEIQSLNLLPVSQPFNTAPWYYTGTETVTSFPTNVVDWILIMARDTDDNIVGQAAGFITTSGAIVAVNGSQGVLLNNALNNYISIHHRNHLAVVSATPYTDVLDFTSSISSVKGTEQLITKGDEFCLHAGDFDANGIINNVDYNEWVNKKSLLNQYLSVDGDGNGVVNNLDYNLWLNNSAKVGYSPIHY